MVNDMGKRENKGAKRRLFLWFSVFVLIIFYVSYSTSKYWKEILKNKKEANKLQDDYDKLISEKEVLETDLLKLQDPEYVAKYAREKYLYSKDGELIIKIVDED